MQPAKLGIFVLFALFVLFFPQHSEAQTSKQQTIQDNLYKFDLGFYEDIQKLIPFGTSMPSSDTIPTQHVLIHFVDGYENQMQEILEIKRD